MIESSPEGKTLAWIEDGYCEVARIPVKITHEDLLRLPDRPGLIQTFNRLHPEGYDRESTLKEQLDLINSDLGKWFGFLAEYNVVPMWKMTRMDLASLDFRAKDLKGCDLSGSKLPKDLRATNFRISRCHGVEAVGSDFTGAILTGSNWDDSNLEKTTWIESVLFGVEMNRANLEGSYWRECSIRYSRFIDSNYEGAYKIDNDVADTNGF